LFIGSFIFCKASISDDMIFAKWFKCREVFCHFCRYCDHIQYSREFFDNILRFHGSETEPRLVFNRF